MVAIQRALQSITSASSNVYPAALLSGDDLLKGKILHLPANAKSLTPRDATITFGPNVDVSLFEPYLPNDAGAFRKNVLSKLRSAEIKVGSDFEQIFEAATRSQNGKTSLELQIGFLGFESAAHFASSATASQSIVCRALRQKHFTLEMSSKPTLAGWFSDAIDAEMAEAWCEALPVYVTKVDYGKICLLIAIVEGETEEAKAAANAAFMGQKGAISSEHAQLLSGARLRLFVHGGEPVTDEVTAFEKGNLDDFEAFRRSVSVHLSPSRSTEYSQPIGFSAETMQSKPNQVVLISATHDTVERLLPIAPFEVLVRPVSISIFQAGYDAFHEQGDFHAAVRFGDEFAQTGYIKVLLGDKRDKAEHLIGLDQRPSGGPFRVAAANGTMKVLVGESDRGPDEAPISIDKAEWEVSAGGRWDCNASFRQDVPYDLEAILDSGALVQFEGKSYRSKTFEVQKYFGTHLANRYTFSVLVHDPRAEAQATPPSAQPTDAADAPQDE